MFKIVPLVLYTFTNHFKKTSEMVLINKYMYQHFYAEPDVEAADRSIKIDDAHYSSTRFLGKYFFLASSTCKVTTAQMEALIQEEFPGLIGYLMDTGVFGGQMPRPQDGDVDFDRLSYHLEVLLPLDWLALYQTAELVERRHGLAIRLALT